MKLSIDDEDNRPTQLTPDFFINLMITETKRKATLQLLEFHKKKELTYSTKITDGFFIVKVMMIHKAAEQLETGCVHINYVVEGWLRNHGEGVIMMREPFRYWKHASKVGNPVNWKLNKENVNSKGFNLIVWNSQQLEELHQAHSVQGRKEQPPREMKSKRKQKSKSKFRQREDQQQKQKGNQEKIKKLADAQNSSTAKTEKAEDIKPQPREVGSLIQTQTQSLDMEKKDNLCVEYQPKLQASSNTHKLHLQSNALIHKQDQNNQKQVENGQGSKFSKMTKSIMELIMAEQEQSSPPPQPILMDSNRPQSFNKKAKQEPTINLKFIYDILDSDQQQQEKKPHLKASSQQLQMHKDQGKAENSQSSDEEFTNWLNSKKIESNPNNQIQKPQIRSSYNRKRQFYKDLLSSSQSQTQGEKTQKIKPLSLLSAPKSLLQPIKPRLANKLKQQIKDLSQIKFCDIYHGLSTKNNADWWTKALICCLGSPTPKNYANAILTDETGHYIITATFINLNQAKQQLIQNRLYKLGKGLVRMSNQETHPNVSHSELQFDCSKATIQPLQLIQLPAYRSQNYQQLNTIYEMEDDLRVNTFGIIKSIRNTFSKNGVISHYEIVDPIVKYSMGFTQFDSHLTADDIERLINLPICIYSGYSGSYRGRKNVVSRPKTIVKYNWLPLIKETAQIWEWLENESNRLQDIDLNLVGYVECGSLDRIMSVTDGRVFVRNVTVLEINDKFTYLACVKCYKKVEDGRCRTCGKRNSKDITQRLLVRGNIGDQSSILYVLWSNQLAQMLVRQGLKTFKSRWLLKKVSVWLQRGANQGYSIVKMKDLQSKVRLKSLFDYINNNIL